MKTHLDQTWQSFLSGQWEIQVRVSSRNWSFIKENQNTKSCNKVLVCNKPKTIKNKFSVCNKLHKNTYTISVDPHLLQPLSVVVCFPRFCLFPLLPPPCAYLAVTSFPLPPTLALSCWGQQKNMGNPSYQLCQNNRSVVKKKVNVKKTASMRINLLQR